MSYQGPDRRQHRILVTQHTEYHMRGATCIAVRDRRSGDWKGSHSALGSDLLGGIVPLANGSINFIMGTDIDVGTQLCFSSDVMTSRLKSVCRPTKDAAQSYVLAA